MKNKKHHIVFEGTELVGKSFLISKIYNYLEKKYNTNPKVLNGCHWFNCDVGVFGTKEGKSVINKYIEILEILKNKNVIFEKLHVTDNVYNKKKNRLFKRRTKIKKTKHKIDFNYR
ncbi:MAG: hypothetical protein ABIA91_00355 [Patescibacteria group bacterium]